MTCLTGSVNSPRIADTQRQSSAAEDWGSGPTGATAQIVSVSPEPGDQQTVDKDKVSILITLPHSAERQEAGNASSCKVSRPSISHGPNIPPQSLPESDGQPFQARAQLQVLGAVKFKAFVCLVPKSCQDRENQWQRTGHVPISAASRGKIVTGNKGTRY